MDCSCLMGLGRSVYDTHAELSKDSILRVKDGRDEDGNHRDK